MMNRRAWLAGGVGTAAAIAGAGWAWWRGREPADTGDGGLWSMRFERPQGGALVMADLRGRPLVLNFWASWCVPCVKEMPQLDRFARDFASQRSEEHTSELQSRLHLVCRLLLEKQ